MGAAVTYFGEGSGPTDHSTEGSAEAASWFGSHPLGAPPMPQTAKFVFTTGRAVGAAGFWALSTPILVVPAMCLFLGFHAAHTPTVRLDLSATGFGLAAAGLLVIGLLGRMGTRSADRHLRRTSFFRTRNILWGEIEGFAVDPDGRPGLWIVRTAGVSLQ